MANELQPQPDQPVKPGKLESEKVVVSAPFSFHGSAARIWPPLMEKRAASDSALAKVGWTILADLAVGAAWLVVLSARLDKKLVSYAPGREVFSWDVAGLAVRVSVLSEAKKSDDFAPLATTFKRVVNILPPVDQVKEFAPPKDLKDDAEIRLIDAFNEVSERAPGLLKAREYGNLFKELRKLKAPVDRFFEQVRVMDADNPDLKAQRLGLLKGISDLFYEIADFSKIIVEHESES